jgi:hypothetical protein
MWSTTDPIRVTLRYADPNTPICAVVGPVTLDPAAVQNEQLGGSDASGGCMACDAL